MVSEQSLEYIQLRDYTFHSVLMGGCCFYLSVVLQSFIVSLSVKLMAKISTFITFFKILSIIFIVLVGVSGVIKRGIYLLCLLSPSLSSTTRVTSVYSNNI